jgi:cyclopropane fatty-acyl-phospholipid synthase-like methyltransferase
MSNIVFDEEMGRIQRAIAESHDLVVRRNIFMDSLNLRTGEKVLELGCGGGSYAFEAARFVGSYAGDWVTRLIRRRGEPAIL